MAGQLANPSKYSSLRDSCICCNAEDQQVIENAMVKVAEGMTKLHALKGDKLYPINDLIQYAKDNLFIVIVNDQYLVAVDVIEHWMSPTRILSEELVYRIAPGDATLEDVLACFRYLAKEFSCDKIIVGTAAAHGRDRHEALAAAYEQAGLEFDFITLRSVQHGRS